MSRFINKNEGFLYWVLMPSLLLVLSVFGVNFISRPVMTQPAPPAPPSCSVDQDCNDNPDINPNGCRLFICNSNICDIDSIGPGIDLSKQGCGVCGAGTCNNNGVCESPVENSADCPGDCLVVIGQSSIDLCALRLVVVGPIDRVGGTNGLQGLNPCNSLDRNFCCPQGCVGDPANTSLFDLDCVCCGDSLTNSQAGEQCDPSGASCTVPGDGAGTCDAQCQCAPNPPQCGNGIVEAGEQCEPPNTATCSATCQNIVNIPTCGDGVVDAGEDCDGATCTFTNTDGSVIPGVCQACVCIPECQSEGSGCGDDGSGGSGVCFSGTGGTGGGNSLIPFGVRESVLLQWLSAFMAPGLLFFGVKIRRRFKK